MSAGSSFRSEGEFYDAHSDLGRLSIDGATSSPMLSARHTSEHSGVLDRLTGWWREHHGSENYDRSDSLPPSPSEPGLHVVEDGEAPPEHGGCIGLFAATQAVIGQKRFLRQLSHRPVAGSSFSRKSEQDTESSACLCWEPADGQTFMVRSVQYMRTKVKVPSEPSIYRLVGADMYSFDSKLYHVAQHITLPTQPRLGPGAADLPPDQQLPPLLIFNVQLPTYAPSLFGSTDGPGHSLIFYFGLEEGWEPSMVENQAALGLMQRFVHNKREHDGQPTRDRLKLIPRIVNPDEWAEKGPLSKSEYRLLINYNDKPLLTRPQQRFYRGEGYLEVDLDVHNYAYIARRALQGLLGRLSSVVFEIAFVVQGNRPSELPEVVLGAVRVYRVDFMKSRPFSEESIDRLGNGEGPPQEGEAAR